MNNCVWLSSSLEYKLCSWMIDDRCNPNIQTKFISSERTRSKHIVGRLFGLLLGAHKPITLLEVALKLVFFAVFI
jgi:hypothetical protein